MYMYTEWISKEEELARFKKAAIAFTKKVTASKEAALEFLISVGYLPADYKLPEKRRSKTVESKVSYSWVQGQEPHTNLYTES